MSKRVLVLVEGPTEERFVKDVLYPVFLCHEVFFIPTILTTKRVKNGPNFKGGVSKFNKIYNDLKKLLKGSADELVTTLIDYYGLPSDTPGMNNRPAGTPLQRVTHVENSLAASLGSPPNFIPFLTLHEFEAWLFSSPYELPNVMIMPQKEPEFAKICSNYSTPEEINEHPEQTPSKRIAKIFPGYRKTLHGPTTVARIGIPVIRGKCPHFNTWLEKIEAFSCS